MPTSPRSELALEDFLAGAAPQGRTQLLPALWHCQNQYGFISKDNAITISKALRIPLADIYGVIEFYTLFYEAPTNPTIVRICENPACTNQGSRDTYNAFAALNSEDFTLEYVPCLGLCEHAPAALIGESAISKASASIVPAMLAGNATPTTGIIYGDDRPLTSRCGAIDPTNIDDYTQHEGFEGLKAAFAICSADVLAQIKASGLKGRGGAAFPTGIKWEGAANAIGEEKYIVCNADESEPGTFKDRVLLEEDPFSVLEGLIIGAYAIGAPKGYFYIRGEYPNAQHIFSAVIQSAYEHGYLGKNILGSGFNFDVELRSGGGAYICGEETSLFESIEGKRGYPRIKPPYPTTHGLFNKPTVINNVETFANVPIILREGPEGYRTYGTENSSGPRLFCLSGDVTHPGVYESTKPLTLQNLLDMAGATDVKAVMLGGAAGHFVPPEKFDVELTFEGTRAAGLTLGSGVVMAFNQSRDLRQALLELAHFFAHESCGKCYPCQLGTQRQLEILERVADEKTIIGDVDRLQDVGWTMTDASLCGLGQTAASAVLSVMEHWPEYFEN